MSFFPKEQEFKGKGLVWPFLKRMFTCSLKYKRWLWSLVIFTLFYGIVEALYPLVWLYYIDHLVTPLVEGIKKGYFDMNMAKIQLLHFAGIYLGITLFQALTIYYFTLCAGSVGEYVMYDLRKQMFSKLQQLSFSFYDRTAVGWLIARITSDSKQVTGLISWGLRSFIWGMTMIIVCFGVMFFYNWQLALIVLITLPFLLLVSVKIKMTIIKHSRRSRRFNSELIASYNEHINGIEVNKATVQEERAIKQFYDHTELLRSASFKLAFYSSIYAPMVVFIGSIAGALIVSFGGHMVLAGLTGMTLGTWAAFFGYVRNIFMPIFDITRYYALAQSSLSAGERIFALIDEKTEIEDKPGVNNFHSIKGEIRFEGVYFYYREERPILKNFNLHIQAGESIALVGPTGEGKSTIANLICRFYEPQKGSIKIDGVDYREKTLHSFRSQLGVILQTPYLFYGTIKQNIKYGVRYATDESVVSALDLIGATEFISRLEEEVGQEGNMLSTGEKQIIALARVIIRDPKILVMDEATSAIDTLAELRIQHGIQKVIEKRTAVIISHRLSTIKNCDRILMIKEGKVVEDGGHDALIRQHGYYYNLYTCQAAK